MLLYLVEVLLGTPMQHVYFGLLTVVINTGSFWTGE